VATWQRTIASPIEAFLGVDIVRRGRAAVTLEKQYLRRLLKELAIDCVFDVGANEGQYGEMLREIGYKGPIVSFEPGPVALDALRRRAGRDRNWFVEGVALDERERDAVFNLTAHSEFSSLKTPSTAETELFRSQNKTTEQLVLRTQTLTPFVRAYGSKLGFSRPLLKLDTQGNDMNVVRGALEVIKEFVALQSELSIKRLYEDQPNYIQSIELYTSLGFELGALTPNNAGQFPLLFELDCVMLNSAFLDRGAR